MFGALLVDNSFVSDDDFFHLFSRGQSGETGGEMMKQTSSHPLSEFAGSQIEFDEIFNFIGTGNPQVSLSHLRLLRDASIHWDSIASRMLENEQAKKYFSMSSGIADEVYSSLTSNQYRDLKVELERRHGATSLPISDIRIFGFADVNGKLFPGSLVGDIGLAISRREPLVTDTSDPVRDYCGAQELSSLLAALRKNEDSRGVSELHSLAPVTKTELLDFLTKSELLSVSRSKDPLKTSTGLKPKYIPRNFENLSGYTPTRNSLEVVCSALGVGL